MFMCVFVSLCVSVLSHLLYHIGKPAGCDLSLAALAVVGPAVSSFLLDLFLVISLLPCLAPNSLISQTVRTPVCMNQFPTVKQASKFDDGRNPDLQGQ